MSVSRRDREILRELAKQVAEIAALPVQQETIRLWQAHNALRPVRPMVTIDQVCWHEMNVNDELTLLTEDKFSRHCETTLRRTLYGWRHMRADMVVEPFLSLHKVVHDTGLGIEVQEERAVQDPHNSVVGHHYTDQMKTDADIARIRTPEISIDEPATARLAEQAHAVFDGAIEVRLRGVAYPMLSSWDLISTWRSVEGALYDLADRPEFMHRLMRRLVDAHMGRLDQLEQLGLLENWPRIHCTGAHASTLPAPGHDPQKLRTQDIWTYGQAQMFSVCSPAMHEEFEIEYAIPWYRRFGLGYYGCCEPLDQKIDIIRRLPNVRKISMSPWVDQERGASQLRGDYVFSRKPNPAFLAPDRWNPAAVERDLTTTRDVCRRHGCPLEFIQKDISTVHYEPQRLWQWAEIARRVVGA